MATLRQKITWHLEEAGGIYTLLILLVLLFGLLIEIGNREQENENKRVKAQQECVMQGKIPADIFGKVTCIKPENINGV